MSKIVLILLLAFVAIKLFTSQEELTLGPGITAEEKPHQTNLNSPEVFHFEDYVIERKAHFELTAKVLSREDYSLGREADLSPTDLALGWGRMSDEAVLNQIELSQSGRFYYWRVDSFPIPRHEIETHSANMHIIPANNYVQDTLNEVRKGDIVKLTGSLVNVRSNDSAWFWNSSLTRNDTGAGACELIWVEELEIVTFQ